VREEVAVNEYSVLTVKTGAGSDPNGHADKLTFVPSCWQNSSNFLAGGIPTNVR